MVWTQQEKNISWLYNKSIKQKISRIANNQWLPWIFFYKSTRDSRLFSVCRSAIHNPGPLWMHKLFDDIFKGHLLGEQTHFCVQVSCWTQIGNKSIDMLNIHEKSRFSPQKLRNIPPSAPILSSSPWKNLKTARNHHFITTKYDHYTHENHHWIIIYIIMKITIESSFNHH